MTKETILNGLHKHRNINQLARKIITNLIDDAVDQGIVYNYENEGITSDDFADQLKDQLRKIRDRLFS